MRGEGLGRSLTRIGALALTALWLPAFAQADWRGFERDFDAEEKPWREIEASLPAAPRPENLIAFEVGPASRNRHYVDAESLSVGEDGVVRYTVVVSSAAGAQNVSFEGMRCATGERKLYAFGRPDGSWSRNRHARWEPIQARSATSYHRELFYHYFCTVEGRADLAAIRRNLRQGGLYRDDEAGR